ncbi:MAG: hypothetical protein WKG07_23815 [Hymenobacter sp.]
MGRLRALTPVQVIVMAVGLLMVFAVAGYFIITQLTTAKAVPATPSAVPAELNNDANRKVLQALKTFEAPRGLPAPDPLRTPDPNSPSTVNPFSR